jgi:hypothetical protein
MTLYVKYMHCTRCRQAVSSEFEKLGVRVFFVGEGEVKTRNNLSAGQREKLRIALQKAGFELIDDKRGRMIERLTCIILEMVYYSEDQLKDNLPGYLSKKLNHDYFALSKLFYDVKNTTIEKYFITHKIELAKELIVYYKLNLTEIAYQLNYNSVAGLSNQIKAVTGFPPVHFKQIKDIRSMVEVM